MSQLQAFGQLELSGPLDSRTRPRTSACAMHLPFFIFSGKYCRLTFVLSKHCGDRLERKCPFFTSGTTLRWITIVPGRFKCVRTRIRFGDSILKNLTHTRGSSRSFAPRTRSKRYLKDRGYCVPSFVFWTLVQDLAQ